MMTGRIWRCQTRDKEGHNSPGELVKRLHFRAQHHLLSHNRGGIARHKHFDR